MRVVFMGSPDFSVPILDALATHHDVAAVYSQPPKAAGRGQRERPCPVHRRAEELGIPVRTPTHLRDPQDQRAFADLRPDVAVVAAYGLILPKALLDVPRYGCINVHASLLPRWRGAAPIQRAIMEGDTETGVTIMQMEPGLDTGPMLLKESVPIGEETTAQQLHDALSDLGAKLILRALNDLEAGRAEAVPQPAEGVTYASKIDKGEARINWNLPAKTLQRHVHGLSPFPGAWFDLNGERVKVLAARAETAPEGKPGEVLDDRLLVACGHGSLRLTRLQPAGGKPMDAGDFLNGRPIRSGAVLG